MQMYDLDDTPRVDPNAGFNAWLNFSFRTPTPASQLQRDEAVLHYFYKREEGPGFLPLRFSYLAGREDWKQEGVYVISSAEDGYALMTCTFSNSLFKGPYNAEKQRLTLNDRIRCMWRLQYVLYALMEKEKRRLREEARNYERARLEYVEATYSSD